MGSATIQVSRDRAWYGRFRSLRVLLDGAEIGKVAWGQTQSFLIAPGPHELTVQMDWVKSESAAFSCRAGDTLQAHCESPRFSWRDLFTTTWDAASKPFVVTITRP